MTDVDVTVHRDYHPGQAEVAASGARFKVLSCGRRWGKTRMATVEAVDRGLRGQRVWWVAPTYKDAMLGWRPIADMVRGLPGVRILLSDYRVEFQGGGFVEVRSADNKQRGLRGQGLDFVFVDEAAYIRDLDEVWRAALRPSLMDRQGGAMFISTPDGLDRPFHELWKQAAGRDGWKAWQFPTTANPHIPTEEIAEAREDLGSLVYSQEILAEFVLLSGSIFHDWFPRFEPVVKDGLTWLRIPEQRLDWRDTVLEERTVDFRECRRFASVDLAVSTKEQADYTVIAAVAVFEGKMFVLDVLRRRLEFPDLVPAMQRMLEKHDLSLIEVERVGYQLAAIQEARRQGLPIKELTADRDKVARALPLAARMEAGDVFFDADAEWFRELKLELLGFPEAKHDDQVDALAYAAQAIARQPGRRKRLDGWVPERGAPKWTP